METDRNSVGYEPVAPQPKKKPDNLGRAEAHALVEAGYMPLKDYLAMFPKPEPDPEG